MSTSNVDSRSSVLLSLIVFATLVFKTVSDDRRHARSVEEAKEQARIVKEELEERARNLKKEIQEAVEAHEKFADMQRQFKEAQDKLAHKETIAAIADTKRSAINAMHEANGTKLLLVESNKDAAENQAKIITTIESVREEIKSVLPTPSTEARDVKGEVR